jgi:hypothetical protein
MRNLFLSFHILFAYPLVGISAVSGDWTYSVSYGGAIISAYSGAGGVVTVPSQLGGYPVRKVGNGYPSILASNSNSVTSIIIPDSVTSIGDYSFIECFSLNSITIPNSVTTIGAYAFANPSSSPFPVGTIMQLSSIAIPNSVTNIGEKAFYGCTKLTNVTIGNGVTSIGAGAFGECSSLTSMTLPNSLKTIGNFSGYGGPYDSGVFVNCSKLISINIGNSVTTIGDYSFYGCSSLTSITIPPSVTVIGNSAFSRCSKLTAVTMPNSVTSVSSAAFYLCTSLTSVNIGNGVTIISHYMFYGCLSLSSVTIPSAVTSIGAEAFTDCTGLERIVFLGNAPTYSETSFRNSSPTVYYVAGTTGWGVYYAGLNTAVIGSYLLTTVCNAAEGTSSVNPIKQAYQSGDSVTISATPKAGYLFGSWSGASTAATSSITLTMNSDKIVTANFIQDGRDSDGDSLTNFQESVTYGTNPNQKDSNADGVEDGHAVSLGYNPTLNFSALIAHPPTGLYTATQMQAMAIGDIVLTKNPNGSFTLNYEIEQSTDLQNWTRYEALSLPLTRLPADKAFIRIKAKQ